MKCEKCGKEMIYEPKKAGSDKYGYSVYHKFAICKDCDIEVDTDDMNKVYTLRKSVWDEENQSVETVKKKDSTLSIVAAVLAGIAWIVPTTIGIGYLLRLGGLIVGLIDCGINDENTRHIGSIFAILIFAIAFVMSAWI